MFRPPNISGWSCRNYYDGFDQNQTLQFCSNYRRHSIQQHSDTNHNKLLSHNLQPHTHIMMVRVICRPLHLVQTLVILRQQKKAVGRNNYRNLQAGACASLWHYCNTFITQAIGILIFNKLSETQKTIMSPERGLNVHYASSEWTLSHITDIAPAGSLLPYCYPPPNVPQDTGWPQSL